jgi:hypothetical protein
VGPGAVVALQIATRPLPSADESAVRTAMLSVYYRSLGRQLELRGAPAVLLPADVRPLGLAEALAVLQPLPVRFRDAVWRLVRSVPATGRGDDQVRRRYPGELVDVIGADRLEFLDERRAAYRRGAHLFGAALVACADGHWDEFRALRRLLDRQAETTDPATPHIGTATRRTLGQTVSELLSSMGRPANRERSSRQIAMISDEVGLDIYDFVADFADTAAFIDFTENAGMAVDSGGATVYPVSSVISQDSGTLTTTATVTTVIRADFDTVSRAIDPVCWPLCSDVIRSSGYVADAFGLDPLAAAERPAVGAGCPGCTPPGNSCTGGYLLQERAALSWGVNLNQQGSFHNVLRIHPYAVRPDRGTVDLHFSLSRSIRSRILWDERAGGLLLDHGYVKVRPLGTDHWRVTSRKILKFSDRTPYANGPGWLDVGQMLNYLAPAALSWWLESEMYSTGCPLYADQAQVAGRLGQAGAAAGGPAGAGGTEGGG